MMDVTWLLCMKVCFVFLWFGGGCLFFVFFSCMAHATALKSLQEH